MTISLTTAIIGGIDEVKSIPKQTVEYERLLFTYPHSSTAGMNPRNQALYYKTQPHDYSTHDICIWVDGKIQITSPDFIQQCIDALGDGNIAIMKHNERKCIYHEVDHIEHCIRKGNPYLTPRYAHRPIREQVEAYRTQGYPANAGLNDCCIFIVRNNTINHILDKWWYECSQLDWFDQVSIRFLCWFYGQSINDIVFKPGTFKDVPHIK